MRYLKPPTSPACARRGCRKNKARLPRRVVPGACRRSHWHSNALAGPEPETPVPDQQRERDRERIERAFPEIDG
jgi:hypothetical protein